MRTLTVAAGDPFWVIFSDNRTASEVTKWIARQTFKPLHISMATVPGAVHPGDVDWRSLRDHFQSLAQAVHQADTNFPLEMFEATLAAWGPPEPFTLDFVAKPHNATVANLLTLKSLGAEFAGEETLVPHLSRISEWIEAIAASAEAVIELADECGVPPVFFARPLVPDRIIAAPSLFTHMRRGLPRPRDDEPKGLRAAVRAIQSQAGYFHVGERKRMLEWLTEPAGQMLMSMRSKELGLQTFAVALRAASTVGAVIRLPNGVNEAAGVKRFTDHARSAPLSGGRDKSQQIYRDTQATLARHVAPRLLDIIGSSITGVKLVADAPLEWLPIGDLPLSLAKDTSRIPATPGDLMIGELAILEPMLLPPEAFRTVLLVSSFEVGDPLAALARHALDFMAADSGGRLKIKAVSVSSVDGFVEAINDFSGAMMIFDGHGHHDTKTGLGTLRIGSDDVDVWSLRGRLKPPPIVILSACDTHSPDRTHSTVGASFLACGSRAVLATLLPISGQRGAVFAGRLALRAAWYLENVVTDARRAILWSNVVSSMIRLDLLNDLFERIEKETGVKGDAALKVRNAVNSYVHVREFDWWKLAKIDLKMALGADDGYFDTLVADVIAKSDSIRYVHLGNPDTIRITSREIQEMEERLGHMRKAPRRAMKAKTKPPIR